MRVMLIGANGQLGFDITRVFKEKENLSLIPLTHNDIEVTDPQSVQNAISRYDPDLIINTAAFHNVERCEEEPEIAFRVNAFAQINLCRICKERKIIYVFFSTDYVFDGEKTMPYVEKDCPRPINIYGISKLAGELIIRYMLAEYYIVRVSGLYGIAGPSGKKYNFVDLMLEKAKRGEKIWVVNDQKLTPTSTWDVSNKLYELIMRAEYGVYHMTNEGECTWFEFAQEIFRIADLHPDLKPCKTGTFGEKVARPKYSVLDNHHLRTQGISEMPHWKDSLSYYIKSKYGISA